MSLRARSFQKEYVTLDPNGKSESWNSEEFWKVAFNPKHPKNNANLGYLVSQITFDKDWDNWEKHPEGDEIED